MVALPMTGATRFLVLLLATGLYAGYSPVAPGTAGSVVGLAVSIVLFGPLWRRSPALCLGVFAVLFLPGCWIAGRAEELLGEPDSPRIVIDEVMGMVATMFANPLTWPWLLGGFAAFRFFDVLKPFPAGLIDRKMRGGAGVMLDDLLAALYANLVLQLVRRVL